MTLAEQLTEIYLKHETWHNGDKLSYGESIKYHERILANGECITISIGEKLIGYVEFQYDPWICYIRNLFILPEYRNKEAIWKLRERLFQVCPNCKIFRGDRNKNGERKLEWVKRKLAAQLT